MSHVEVLKRAWKMLWSYRAVWVFGIILALTTVSWETVVFYGGGNGDDKGASVNYVNDEGGKLILNYKRQADGQSQQSRARLGAEEPSITIRPTSSPSGYHTRIKKATRASRRGQYGPR